MDKILQEAYKLKQEIDEKTSRLKDLNAQIAELATFKSGSKTGHLAGQYVKAKVVCCDNVKWFQDRLDYVRQHFTGGIFEDAFRPEYKPISKKALDTACVNPDFAKAVEWAREVKPGAPTVTLELVDAGQEEDQNAA